MKPHQHIAAYEAILETSGHMVEAAQKEDWDGLVELENKCRALVENVVADPLDCALDGTMQRRKGEIIRKVLADDAQIRSITEPWLDQLSRLLSTASRERNVQRAYGFAARGK